MIGVSERPRRPRAASVWIAVALLALLSVGVTALRVTQDAGGVAVADIPAEIAQLETLERGFTWIAESVKPSVVFLEVEGKLQERASAQVPFDIPEQWREFFGPGFPRPGTPAPPRIPMNQGSGVIIDPDGHILTNNHVVDDALRLTVHLANGDSYPAEVVGADRLTDLAVIKIEPDRALPAARLGNADETKAGAWVMAVGFPFGGGRSGGRFDEALRYEPTVTVGVISATKRQLGSDMVGRPYRDLLQTDAPINPGNSGGPLVNTRAEVIGINQAIFTPSPWAGNIGVGFAIPISGQNREVIDTLRGGGAVVRGQLGVSIKALSPALMKNYGAEHGVFVQQVQADSPAARGGLEDEDVVLTYDGEKVVSQEQFVQMVQRTPPGTSVKIEVLREEKVVALTATVGEMDLDTVAEKPSAPEQKRLGLTVAPISEEQASRLGIPGGVAVRAVDPVSDGARAGVRPGDVIVKVNRDPVSDVESYQSAVAELEKGGPLVLRVLRRGDVLTLELDSLSD